MLKLFIQGLKDGTTDVEVSCNVEQMPFSVTEFFGKVTLIGKLRKIGQRYIFIGQASADARLVCDLSLEEYEQTVTAEINITAVINSDLARLRRAVGNENEIALLNDDKYIDLTDDVRELLELNLPMKRVHPKYEGKSLEDIFPEYAAANNSDSLGISHDIDESDPWRKLKEVAIATFSSGNFAN
jgi:uncharacterized metal-binding protein YceD (DUF177 family)